ncbi:hypothetical protein NESM_000625300 [Novymonas esmeraldas]|uniref:Uncharacterized protein n=1 Tax=Novymonas esmeraldas TaxID=1808958 RepID=A0AAW0EUR7_9TRYP
MQVLSDATPMTDGEVYALLRRRRDERNAARHPPFALQPALADNHQRTSLPASSTTTTTTAAAAAAAAVVPTPVATSVVPSTSSRAASAAMGHNNSSSSRAVPAGAIESAAAAAAAATASVLLSPSSGHLVVLLTEVTTLNYIANNSAFVGESAAAGADHRTRTPRDVYGPPSVHDRHPATATATATAAATSALVDAELVAACTSALAAHRPGTRGHVRATDALLSHWEDVGRAQERRYADGVRRALQQMWRRGLWAPTAGPHPPPAPAPQSSSTTRVKTEPAAAEAEEDISGAQAAAGRSALPPLPLSSRPLLLEPSPLWGPAAERGGGAVVVDSHDHHHHHACRERQQTRWSLLSEAEVMRLVVGRPQCMLDVYRLLDDVDGRLGHNDAAISAFVEAITAVFAD